MEESYKSQTSNSMTPLGSLQPVASKHLEVDKSVNPGSL
jgi:hypothetical protein